MTMSGTILWLRCCTLALAAWISAAQEVPADDAWETA
jgi:hypothetical protein